MADTHPTKVSFIRDLYLYLLLTENIFLGAGDCTAFLALLMELFEILNVKVSAYCLLPIHYHILLQTWDASLSKFMRHLDGVYTQRFNRSHHCDGQLFRSRYRSVLVDADAYLLELVRYIHRNPLQPGLVDKLGAYKWSSHGAYVSEARKWDWLHRGFILSILAGDKRQQRRLYRQFVATDTSEEITEIFKEEVPESRLLPPDREQIKGAVCKTYHVNEPRNVAIYLILRLRGEGLDEICREFHLKRYSSASSAIERVRVQMSRDRQLKVLQFSH